MDNIESIYNAFGLKESDLKGNESPNIASTELQLKIFEEKIIKRVKLING